MSNNCVLLLENGSIYKGSYLGFLPDSGVKAECVFNTSLSGYEEIISDPSYRGQFVVFTYPSIGNTGITIEDLESTELFLEGIILKDYFAKPTNWRHQMTLDAFMKERKRPIFYDIDTRKLVREIREYGSLMGYLLPAPDSMNDSWIKDNLDTLKKHGTMEGRNLADVFNGSHVTEFFADEPELSDKVAVIDFGVKKSILTNFYQRNLQPVLFSGTKPLAEQGFQESDFKGIFLSNGPGDPAAVEIGIENIQWLLANTSIPILGICLGYQLMSLALGLETYKLKFGHHGGNQPVYNSKENKVWITAQNHGFAVKQESLTQFLSDNQSHLEINPNDQTAEGYQFIQNDRSIYAVQYHPEAAPGPNDASEVFDSFVDSLSK